MVAQLSVARGARSRRRRPKRTPKAREPVGRAGIREQARRITPRAPIGV